MTNINLGTLIPIIISILALGLGCVFFVLTWRRKRKEEIIKTWLPTPGIILTSEIKEHNGIDPVKINKVVSIPMVRYQYSCGGKTYTGYRITFSSIEYSQAKAQQVVTRYSPGSSVTVFYDPLHPEEAILEKHTRGVNLFFTTGLVLTVLGIGSCCISLLVYWIGKAVR